MAHIIVYIYKNVIIIYNNYYTLYGIVVSFLAMRPTLQHSHLKERNGLMKFSPRKKAKMRKARFKRIKRECKCMIGGCLDYDSESKVVDQATFKDALYLLTKDINCEYAIYKVVQPREYVKVSEKKVLRLAKKLTNPDNWMRHSEISISENGKITTAKVGNVCGNYDIENEGFIFVFII